MARNSAAPVPAHTRRCPYTSTRIPRSNASPQPARRPRIRRASIPSAATDIRAAVIARRAGRPVRPGRAGLVAQREIQVRA